jgi:hypothetical protein
MDSTYLDKLDKIPITSKKEKKKEGEYYSETPSKFSWKNKKNKKRFFWKCNNSTLENC